MSTYKDSIQILLNSQFATQYKNGNLLSNVYFSFPSLLVDDPSIIYKTISISNCQIPVSYYIINEYNDILYYKIGTGSTQTLSITHGNYNATTFITQFKSQMGTGWDASINKLTGILTFTYTSTFSFLVNSSLFSIIGFSNQTYTSTGLILNAPNLADFSGIRNIAIRSSVLSLTNRDCKTNSYSQNIQIIPVNQPAYGIIKFENIANFSCILNNKHIDGFDIQLIDDKGNYVDMNSCHYSITIQIDIYRKNNTNDTMSYTIATKIQEIINLLSASSKPDQQEEPQQENVPVIDEQVQQVENNQEIIDSFNPDNSLDVLLYNNQI